MIATGEIMQIDEVLRESAVNQSVRVTGRLDAYDANKQLAILSFQNSTIVLSTQMLANFEFSIGSMYQFIGETYAAEGKLQLKARVGRNVDGLEIQMYMDALKLRREFIKTTMAA